MSTFNFIDFSGLFNVIFNSSTYPLTCLFLASCVILFCVSVVVRFLTTPFRGF